ncbi:probable cytochrome P450 524A1 isoform X3 [Sycon ciliatum]|uniref:probable cytochrome P450 524A1 isoform X3 n=1 Tax=Sycon ciliatum TaxID=27933 RepID=UPI0031F6F878
MWLELTLFILTVVLGLAAVEQWSFYRKRAWLPGPASAPPFIGYIVDMVKRPFDFYEEQRRYGNMSWTSILGRFFLFVNDGETMRKVFNNMGDAFRLQLTLSAPIMLGKDKNIAYMNGPAHKALRKMLLPLFTRSALGVYLSIQEATILEHLDHWIRSRGSVDTFVEMRPRIRDMNVHTSYKDASTSSLVWMVQLLHDHPDVREKMVEEQRIVRPNNEPLSTENIETMTYANQVCLAMTYANQVVREVLRYRPPVTMVPHVAVKDCQLTSDYKVKKGTIVIPYLWAPQHEDFEEGTSFRPDRWSPEKRTEAHGKSFLVFGHGPHVCLGQRYAMNHLVAFAALLVTRTKWTRKVTESGDKIIYLPTIYPADGCMVNVQPA